MSPKTSLSSAFAPGFYDSPEELELIVKEVWAYLEGQRADGALLEEEGTFTVFDQKARKRLVESVPQDMASAVIAASYIHSFLCEHGLEPEPSRSLDGMLLTARYRFDPERSATITFLPPGNHWSAAELVSDITEAIESPLASKRPAQIYLSRALLILEHLCLPLVIRFQGLQQADIVVSPSPEILKRTLKSLGAIFNRPLMLRKRSVSFTIGHSLDWRKPPFLTDKATEAQFREAFRSSSSLVFRELSALAKGQRFAGRAEREFPHPSWLMKSSLREPEKPSWLERQARSCVLIEHLVPGDRRSPLLVNSKLAPSSKEQLSHRLCEGMSGWQRYRSKANRLLLRTWSEPPETKGGHIPCRAIFALTFSSNPSRIVFCNWGRTPEERLLNDLPSGLVGLVYWPQLKQSLYGEQWVRDEAYDEAVQWATSQATKVFLTLVRESRYLWDILRLDIVRGIAWNATLSELERWIAEVPDSGL